MTDRFATSDAHAYVDSCMNTADSRVFEARLREDVDLRRRIELWRAQNEAIRLAYGAPPRPRGPLSLGRPANENPTPRKTPEMASRQIGGLGREGAPSPPIRKNRQIEPPRVAAPARRKSSRLGRGAAIAALSLGFLSLTASGGPSDPRDSLMNAGAAAYRAFGAASSAPLDFTTHDARALAKWLSPKFGSGQISRGFDVPGWTLMGVRIVPGPSSAAAFIVFENEDRVRAGLLVEQLGAPPALEPLARRVGLIVLAARTERGAGIAAVGPSVGVVASLMRAWSRAFAGAD